jgi:hypothetical protein
MTHPLERQILMIQETDLRVIEEKDATYKGSWHKRGGVGAFMMLARKWDRLEQIAQANGYDIFKVIAELNKYSHAEGGLYAEIGDLRRYLLLVEAFMAKQREDELRVDKHYGAVSACPESVGRDPLSVDRQDIICSACRSRWITDYSFCPACGTRLHTSPQRETS